MIRERFERDGWALVQGFLTPREVDALRSASDELASKGAHLLADAEIDGTRYQVQTASGRRGERAIVPGALRKIAFASSASQEVALLSAPRARVRTESLTASAPPRRTLVHRCASHHSASSRTDVQRRLIGAPCAEHVIS